MGVFNEIQLQHWTILNIRSNCSKKVQKHFSSDLKDEGPGMHHHYEIQLSFLRITFHGITIKYKILVLER